MGAGKEYRINGDAAALAKLSRPPVSTSSGGGAAAVVSEAADSLAGLSVTSPAKRPPPSGACALSFFKGGILNRSPRYTSSRLSGSLSSATHLKSLYIRDCG